MRKILLALICSLPAVAFSQTKVEGYTPNMTFNDGGIVYVLPKSVVELRIDVTKTTYTPGEYAQYAENELGIKDVSRKGYESWSLDNCDAVSVGIPDTDKAFFIEYKAKSAAPLVTLTKDGLIRGINMQLPKLKDDVFKTTIERDNLPNAEQFMTEEMLLASSLSKKAQLAASEIFDIRESRNLLLKGEAETMPGDNESLKLVLSKLNEQEKVLTSLFTGTTVKEHRRIVVKIIPSGDMNDEVAFRFSKHFGVVASDDLSGDPIYVTLKNLHSVEQAADDASDKKKQKIEGVVYNIPGKASVSLRQGETVLCEKTLLITQFGNVETLGNVLFNKSSQIRVEFDPNTGSLLKVDRAE